MAYVQCKCIQLSSASCIRTRACVYFLRKVRGYIYITRVRYRATVQGHFVPSTSTFCFSFADDSLAESIFQARRQGTGHTGLHCLLAEGVVSEIFFGPSLASLNDAISESCREILLFIIARELYGALPILLREAPRMRDLTIK